MNKQNNKAAHDFEAIRKVATDSNTPIDLRRVQQYSAYLQGAMAATEAFVKCFPQITKGKDAPYNKAIIELAISSKRNMDLFLTGEYEIRFRNHKNDRRGKCIECEAYFARLTTTIEEVRLEGKGVYTKKSSATTEGVRRVDEERKADS